MKPLRTHTSLLTYVSLSSLIIAVRSIRGLSMTLTTNQLQRLWTLTTSILKVCSANYYTPLLCFPRLIIACASEENDSLDKAHLKELLYDEIVSFVPSI